MKNVSRLGTWIVMGLIALAGPGTCPVAAADAAALVRDANAALRSAQGSFFNGKTDDAAASLKKAEGLVQELKAVDASNVQIGSLDQKCAKLKKDIEARQARSGGAPAAAPPSSSSAGSGATAASQPDKLPAGAAYRLREAETALGKAERALESTTASADWRTQSARAGLDTARAKLDEIQKQFGAQVPSGHPSIQALTERIAGIEKKIAETAAGAAAAQQTAMAGKAESEKWVARLSPYVQGPGRAGHDKNKWLPASVPRALDELALALNVRGEAAAALADYDKAGPKAPGDDLAELVRQLRYALDSFAASHKAYVADSLQSAETLLAQQEQFIKAQEAKATAGGEALMLQKDQLADSRGRIERAAALVAPDDSRVKSLRDKLTDLEKRDAAIRKARVAQTRLIPDRYAGSDLAALKAKAEKIVVDAVPGARVLRTTVISADWKEESVLEHTDSTRTALRFRTTRSVTAQVAAQAGGEVKLHTLDISKDRRTDGTWGALYGHIMFTDPMLPENVNK